MPACWYKCKKSDFSVGEILRDVNVEERRAARMMMGLGSGQKVNPACSRAAVALYRVWLVGRFIKAALLGHC